MTQNEQTFELTDDHIKLLRALVFLWMDAGEAGVPMAYGYSATYHEERDRAPYEPLDRYTDMIRILGLNTDPANLPSDQRSILDRLDQELGFALSVFLNEAALTPGTYSFPNYLKGFPDVFMPTLYNTWELYDEWRHVPVPQDEMITFDLTAQHLILLRALRIKWEGSYNGVWTKRPYGDMSFFEIDMAELLGVTKDDDTGDDEFSDEQMRYFDQMHTDMLYALPVFLRHGTIKTETYPRPELA
jgi:hypothetical protein